MSTFPIVRLTRAVVGRRALVLFVGGLPVCTIPQALPGQLTLDSARGAAQRTSPEVRAAREAVIAAAARERQAAAHLNPILAYGREQTSRDGQTNAQDIVQVEQPLELGGQRAARREAARVRREGAEARLVATRAQLDLDVVRAFALAVAADQRARLAAQTAEAFLEAQRVSERRLAAGDVSGYIVRRLRLEAARFASVRAAAALERQSARTLLSTLMGLPLTASDSLTLPTELPEVAVTLNVSPLDSLLAQAQRDRPELHAVALDAVALAADARLAARERIPIVVFSAGYKGERVADPTLGSLTGFRGVIAGLSVPLPIFDRRMGAIGAAKADVRRATADGDAVRRRVAREVADALDALRTAETQRAALAPHLGEDALVAIRAVQASYAEGEITLVEWLDAVRAYQDAESTYLSLQAEVAVRRAALARAMGAPLFPSASPDR